MIDRATQSAFDRWCVWPAVEQRDVSAEGHALDLLAMLRDDPSEERLQQILIGDVYMEILSRVVKAVDADDEADKLRQQGRTVLIEPAEERHQPSRPT